MDERDTGTDTYRRALRLAKLTEDDLMGCEPAADGSGWLVKLRPNAADYHLSTSGKLQPRDW